MGTGSMHLSTRQAAREGGSPSILLSLLCSACALKPTGEFREQGSHARRWRLERGPGSHIVRRALQRLLRSNFVEDRGWSERVTPAQAYKPNKSNSAESWPGVHGNPRMGTTIWSQYSACCLLRLLASGDSDSNHWFSLSERGSHQAAKLALVTS